VPSRAIGPYPADVTAPLILDIGLVLLAAAGAGWLARRVRLPAVVGYLAVGLAVSPFTPGYVASREQVQLLADVGVALLLFEVGVEIDFHRLRSEHRELLAAAPIQVAITTLLSGMALMAIGLPLDAAALIALGVASSSSVVVVNITRSKRRTTDPETERAMLGWSVVQDVAVVAGSIVILGVVGLDERGPLLAFAGFLGFALVAAAVSWVLPRVLTALHAESDLFLIMSVAAALTVAAVGDSFFGVPLALAAFIAGLAITESPATTQARLRLLPFRDLFAVMFFIAVGSLIDPGAVGPALPAVALLLALVIGTKIGVTYLAARLANLPRPLQLSIGLGQIGEFSFVIVSAGAVAGIVPPEWFAATLAAVVITIAASAVLARLVGPPRSAAIRTG
jgi:CPA2 family monovalent cation:H+ antiporter-2